MQDWTSLLLDEADAAPEGLLGAPMPLLATQQSLLDSDVPELVAPAIVEVNSSAAQEGDATLGITSTLSVSLLRRLVEKDKQQRALRKKRLELIESIGARGVIQVTNRGVRNMFGLSDEEEEEDEPAADPLPNTPGDEEEEEDEPAADPLPNTPGDAAETSMETETAAGASGLVAVPRDQPPTIFSNPSEQAAASDEVEVELLQDGVMRQRLEQMAAHRRSEADAPDIRSSSVRPTTDVEMPVQAGELLKRSRPENYDMVLFAIPKDGSAPFQIAEGTLLSRDEYNVEEITRQEATARGLISEPQLPDPQDPQQMSEKRRRKRPVRFDDYKMPSAPEPRNPSTQLVPVPRGETGEEEAESEGGEEDEEDDYDYGVSDPNAIRDLIEQELGVLRSSNPTARTVTDKGIPNAIKRARTDTAEQREAKEQLQEDWRNRHRSEQLDRKMDLLAIQSKQTYSRNCIGQFMHEHKMHNNRDLPSADLVLILLAAHQSEIEWFLQQWPVYSFTRESIDAAKKAKDEMSDDGDTLRYLESSAASYGKLLSDAEAELKSAIEEGEPTLNTENRIRAYKAFLQAVERLINSVYAAIKERPWAKKNKTFKRLKKVNARIKEAVDYSDEITNTLSRRSKADQRLSLEKVAQRESGRRNPHVDKVNALVDRMKTAPVSERVSIENEYLKELELYNSWIDDDDEASQTAKTNMSLSAKLMKQERVMQQQFLTRLKEVEDERNAVLDEIDDECDADRLDALSRELVQLHTDLSLTSAQDTSRLYQDAGYVLGNTEPSDEQRRMVVSLRKAELEAELNKCDDLEQRNLELSAQYEQLQKEVLKKTFAIAQLDGEKRRAMGVVSTFNDKRTKRTAEQQEQHREYGRTKKARDAELIKETKQEFGSDVPDDIARMKMLRSARKQEYLVRGYIQEFKAAIAQWDATEERARANAKASKNSLTALTNRVEKEANDLEKGASEQIKSLSARGKSVVALKAWDEYTKSSAGAPSPSPESGYDALEKLNGELQALKLKVKECAELITKAKAEKKRISEKLASVKFKEVERLRDGYKVVLSNISEFRSINQTTEYLEARLTEMVAELKTVSGNQITSFEQVEALAQERDNAAAEFASIKSRCIDVANETRKKEQEKSDLEAEYKKAALDLYNQHATSAASSSASEDPDAGDVDKIADAMRKQRKAIELRKTLEDAEKKRKNDYVNFQNAAAHERSADPVIQQRGRDRKRKQDLRDNIKRNFVNMSLYKEFDKQLLDDAESVLEPKAEKGKQPNSTDKFLSEVEANKLTRKLGFEGSREAVDAMDKIALSAAASKRIAPKALTGDRGGSSSSEGVSIVYTDDDQERDATEIRHTSYDDSIQQMQFFALGGSTRALSFYAIVAWYVNRFKMGVEKDDPQIVATNATFSRDTDPEKLLDTVDPSNDVFTIKWYLVDRYKPKPGWRDLGNELKYVLAQWASLPLERRAGSHPDNDERNAIIASNMISLGADGTKAVVDPITGELMVVTTEDKKVNDAMDDAVTDAERGSSDAKLSYPLGRLKRTPVAWVLISRRGEESLVPVDDKLSIVRKRPGRGQAMMYPLHLTNEEALDEFYRHASSSSAARPVSGRDLHATGAKWWKNDKKGARYGDLQANELTAAMWEAILNSREHLATQKANLTLWEERVAKLTQQKEDAYKEVAETSMNVFTMTASTLQQDAEILDVDIDELSNQSDRLKRVPNYTTAGAMPENVRSINQALVAAQKKVFQAKLKLSNVYGLPMFRQRASPVIRSKVEDILEQYSTAQTISAVAKPVESPGSQDDDDGLFFKSWMNNPVFFARVATYINRFLSLFYEWERPIGDYPADLSYMRQCINWMADLRDYKYTHVAIQVQTAQDEYSDERVVDVKCWFVDAVSHHGKMRSMGPGMTDPGEGVLDSTPAPRFYHEEMNTYSFHPRSRLQDFEEQDDLQVSRKPRGEEWASSRAQTIKTIAVTKRVEKELKAGGIEQMQSNQMDRHMRLAVRNPMNYSTNPNASVSSDARARQQQLQQYDREVQQLRFADAKNAIVLGSSLAKTDAFDVDSFDNPIVEVVIPGPGMVSERISFRIRDILENTPDPTRLNEILFAMGDKYSGQFATAIKVVTVENSDGSTEEVRVGTIVRMGHPYDTSIDEKSLLRIVRGSNMVYDSEFAAWLKKEAEQQKGVRRLGVTASESGSSSALPLAQPPVPALPDPQPALALTDQSRGGRADDPMEVDGNDAADDGNDAADDGDDAADDGDDAAEDELPDATEGVNASASTDESDRKLLADADVYIRAIENTPAPTVEAAVMRAIMSMYDPGALRPPVAVEGCLIRPLPLPDIEIEVA